MGNKYTEMFQAGPAPETNTMAIYRAIQGDVKARQELLERYWGTIYLKFYELAMLNQGRLLQDRDRNEKAKDLTQGFIQAFLEGKSYLNLEKFDPKKGKFRNLLKQGVTYYFQDATKRDERLRHKFDSKEVPPFVSLEDLKQLSEKIDGSQDPEAYVDQQWAKDALMDLLVAFFGFVAQNGEKEKGEILYYFLITKDFESLKSRLNVQKPRETIRKLLQEFRDFIKTQMEDEEERELVYKLLQVS